MKVSAASTGARYVKPPASVPDRELTVTTTSAAPAAPGGVMAVIVLSLLTVTLVAETPPIFTVAPDVKCSPVIVTTVPPVSAPFEGSIAVTFGVYSVVVVADSTSNQ